MEISEILNTLNDNLNIFLTNAGIWAPFFSSILIFLESFLAFLPLCVFVTINVLSLGTFLGCIVSWISTTLGCFTSFLLFRLALRPVFKKFTKNNKHLYKFLKMINKMPFSRLVLIISIPITPSFFVNFAAGLSQISKKKYFYALLLAKTTIVIFWGVLGSSIVDCLTNPLVLIKVILMILSCNIIGKFFNKKFELDDIFEKQ